MNSAETSNQEPQEISKLVEHLFRHESGKMVAILTRIFGVEHLTLAEDVVQEALARALQTWPFYGVPKNPSAWLMRASRNLALDVVRRQKVFRDKEPEIVRLIERPMPSPDEAVFEDQEIADDRLRMMFVCCHPLVPADAQVALALNTLCGFSVTEISRAFLATDAAIAKRLTRAKQKIREAKIPFEIPAGEELVARLDGVLQALYLLFNEGYKASSGEKLVREDICEEAIRLTSLLAGHAVGNQPQVHALLALMLLNAARLNARVDADGNLLRLREQDRSSWNQATIARGMFHLTQSAKGNDLTAYHLQAAIAACHCSAPDWQSTDWPRILSLYDQLVKLDDSPVIALNRAVAVAEVRGSAEGIKSVAAIPDQKSLGAYYLFYAVLAEFEIQLKDFPAAAEHLRRAIQLTEIKSERALLEARLCDCGKELAASERQ